MARLQVNPTRMELTKLKKKMCIRDRKNAAGLGGRIAESYRAGSEKIKDTATKNMDRTVQMLTEKISEI